LQEGLIYVGTDDGMVQITEDGGETWRGVSKFGSLEIPEYGYINDIEADLHDANTVYVAVNNHKRGDFKPYLLKSTDRGQTWQTLHSDLPERGSVYSIKQDHEQPNLLFCGTEFGCFTTVDGGQKWIKMGGLPTVAIRDIEIQQTENDLVLASFGRGFFILDDYSPLRLVNEDLLGENAVMPIKTGLIHAVSAPMSGSGKAYQGASFFTAPNPPYGVAITYHLKSSLKSNKAKRKEADKKLARAGKDSPYPSWDEFKAEDREVAPRVVLTIRDADGQVVNRLRGSTSKGMHRTYWNLRHAGFGRGGGPLAIPGTYTVDVTQVVDGETTQLVAPTEFEIEPLTFGDTSERDREAIVGFVGDVQKLSIAVRGASSVANAAADQLSAIRDVIRQSTKLDPALENTVREMEMRLMDIQEAFNGDPTKSRRNEPAAPGLSSRLRNAMMGAMGSTEGPTGTHQRQFEIAGEQYEKVVGELRKLAEVDLPALHEKLDAANAPWTPGRKIPKWEK
ncbi:MAG: glycosyl hydrolase, partial [Planctomycetota bacterium]